MSEEDNWRTGFTCAYLLSVVDQKNLISRHGREGEAYKNSFYLTYQISGIHCHGNESEPGLHANKKIQNNWEHVVKKKKKKKEDMLYPLRATLLSPYMLRFSPLLVHTPSCFAFIECILSDVFERVQLKWGQKVCEVWHCSHSEAPWGQDLGLDEQHKDAQAWVTS